MFGPLKPPPPKIASRPSPDADGSTGARVQLRVLCAYLLKELLNQTETEIEEAFVNYGENLRDLYDNIIVMINAEPTAVKSKHNISKMSNIFDEYAGIAIDEREFQAPEGIKVFKNIGYVKDDGTLAPLPTLKPKVKTPGPPLSPTRTIPFPPGPDPNDPQGVISPTSPGGNELMKWPMSHKWLETAGPARGINKIPNDKRDVVVGDGSVLPPTRSKSYRDAARAAMGKGGGKGGDQGRSLPEVALPGRSSSSSGGQKIVTDAPDIKLDVLRDITEYESNAWLPDRINQASKFVTTYLRHGADDKRYNVHSSDGYVRVAILVQLPELKRNSVDFKLLELIMMHAQSGIMMNDEGTKLKAIQGHTYPDGQVRC